MITVKRSEYNKAKLRKLFRNLSQQYIQITEEEAEELGLIEHVDPTGPIELESTGEPEIIDDLYYWYVGNEQPTNNTNPKITKGWTSLESKPNKIDVYAEDPNWNEVQWYLAAPSEWGFDTVVNGVNVGGWIKSKITINNIEYNIWTAQILQDTINLTLA